MLTRADIVAMAGDGPAHLVDADLSGADLSGLDLAGWHFERCDMRRTSLAGTLLEATRWQSVRAAFAGMVGADLTDAQCTASDFNNAAMRSALTGQMTMR